MLDIVPGGGERRQPEPKFSGSSEVKIERDHIFDKLGAS